MSNTLGEKVKVTVFGESHGPYVGAVLDGLSAGIKINDESIKDLLSKRRPQGKGETQRVEADNYQIVSGIFNGYTTGAPITVLIPNTNTHSSDYEKLKDIPRPSHADYVAREKYAGFSDYRGGGHFSGRVTAPLVALGAIVIDALEAKGIKIFVRIKECGGIEDFPLEKSSLFVLKDLNRTAFPTISREKGELMQKKIEETGKEGDSIGGVIEVCVIGNLFGLGEPWFSSVEGKLSEACFAIGGVKGIEFGEGFAFKEGKGSSLNDQYAYEEGEVRTLSNHNGGINGGIANGEPIVFRLAIKPTPSIYKKQTSVDLAKEENVDLNIEGRHDPAIIRRICPVIRAMTSFVIADLFEMKNGENSLRKL
ncbi:MAG: chorismate synthase [Bacilli bacterium]|nr:chorismate synthase [Bacilli bacterium]